MLESQDLSSNELSGNIPLQLTKVTSLEKLNLSRNFLTGEIPRGNQFDTFGAESVGENPGLCGFQLSKPCLHAKSPSPSTEPYAGAKGGNSLIDWEYYRVGIACGGGT
ncbi:Receptor-like protein 9DC3 [Linum perenne]